MRIQLITPQKTTTLTDPYYRWRMYDSFLKIGYCIVGFMLIMPYYHIFSSLEWLYYSQTVIGGTMVLVLLFLPLLMLVLVVEAYMRWDLDHQTLRIDTAKGQIRWQNRQYSIKLRDITVRTRHLSWWNWESLFVRSKPFVHLSWSGLAAPIHVLKSTWKRIP